MADAKRLDQPNTVAICPQTKRTKRTAHKNVPEFDTKHRQPFHAYVIHNQTRVRWRIIDTINSESAECFECLTSFQNAVDAGRIVGPGVIFTDMNVFRKVLRTVKPLQARFLVVPLATPELEHKAIAAVRSKAAFEWIDAQSGFTGIFAKAAARRAYCVLYDRPEDLNLQTPHGVPVTISDEERSRIAALTPHSKKTLMLFSRGMDRDAIARKIGLTRANVSSYLSEILSALRCRTLSEASRLFIAVKARGRR
jgi:DNA-binding NarL/FixJ family response regulator